MYNRIIVLSFKLSLFLTTTTQLYAAGITSTDSTQPRGAPISTNDLGQDISPLIDGIMSPHQRSEYT
jgi:hypothetical protein